jgi:hypothetical protein
VKPILSIFHMLKVKIHEKDKKRINLLVKLFPQDSDKSQQSLEQKMSEINSIGFFSLLTTMKKQTKRKIGALVSQVTVETTLT